MLHIHDLGFVAGNVPNKLPLHFDAAHDLGLGHCISELIYDREKESGRGRERGRDAGVSVQEEGSLYSKHKTTVLRLDLVDNGTDFSPHMADEEQNMNRGTATTTPSPA